MRAQFVFHEVWIGLRRNLTMTIALVVVVAISLSLRGTGLLFVKQVDSTRTYWQSKVEISVYLCTAASPNPNCHGSITPAQQQQIQDEARAKIVAVMKDELDWSRMEPRMVEVYRNSFTPEEIAGMLKFYDSPIGRSVIVKQPQATAQLMQFIHEDMRTVIPQIVQIQQDAGARIRAAGESSPASEPAQH